MNHPFSLISSVLRAVPLPKPSCEQVERGDREKPLTGAEPDIPPFRAGLVLKGTTDADGTEDRDNDGEGVVTPAATELKGYPGRSFQSPNPSAPRRKHR